MSKKINNKTIDATVIVNTEASVEAKQVEANSLKDYFEKYPNASLRKLAVATDSTYGLMLKYSKQPIVGEAYDPDATNWPAVEAYLTKRGVNLSEVDWEALNNVTVRSGSIVKNADSWAVGDKVYIRKNATTPYTILYKTQTHVVIMLEGSSEPMAWAWNTFFLNGPQTTPRAEKVATEVEQTNDSSSEFEEG